MTPDDLDAREQIRDLVARYNSNGDSGRFAQVLELFHPAATMTIGDAVYRGLDEIETIFTSTRDRVRVETEGAPGGPMRHHTATHQIDVVSASEAHGRCYFQVIMGHGLDHWGRYIDVYRCDAGRWCFASRTVITDGYAPDSMFG